MWKCSPFVKRILGRDDDYIVLRDGHQIGRLDVVFKGIEDLVEDDEYLNK